MPRKPSSYYPQDLPERLNLLSEGFEKHAQDFSDSNISKEFLEKLKDDYTDARYKVTELRTELSEAIEAREKRALETYQEVLKVVGFLKYKYGAENLALLDFGVSPRRGRERKAKTSEEKSTGEAQKLTTEGTENTEIF